MTAIETTYCHPNGINSDGDPNSEVVLVGIAPGRDETLRTKKPFTGQSGQLLNSVLRAVEWPREKCYLTNLICWWKDAPDKDDIASCANRLSRELHQIKPKVIVALGQLATERFTGMRFGQVRGACLWSEEFNCWVISTWHPAAILRGAPALVADLVRDLAKIEYIKDKPRDFGDVQYNIIHTVEEGNTALQFLSKAGFVALDIETKWDALSEKWTDDIRCLSVSDGDATYVFPEHVLEAGLNWPINAHWTFHNGLFDTRILKSDLGVDLPICDDTMLMSYSLDERGGAADEVTDIAVGIHGLKKLSREYCGADFYEIDLKDPSEDTLWKYNAKDACYTARLAKMFYEKQIAQDVRAHYLELTLPQALLSRDEWIHGIHVHQDRLNTLAIDWMEEWLRLDEEVQTDAKGYGWPEPQLNFNSPKQLKRFFNTYLYLPVSDTRKETLHEYREHPWIAKYQRLKRIDKQLNVYVLGTQKNVYPDDRVRPDVSLHGTTSGRVTYHNPPIGTVPTGAQYVDPDEEDEAEALIEEFSRVRGMFGAPEGHLFVEADYQTAELWVAALYSGDPVMLQDLESGDFHSNAAETMFAVKRENYSKAHWGQIRRESKYVTFGVLYGRQARSLYSPSQGQGGNLGNKYTYEQIEQMVVAWRRRYRVFVEWGQEIILQSRRTGEFRSISGRLRRYNAPGLYGKHFDNMAQNFPVQAVSHDHLIKARLDMYDLIKQGKFPGHTLFDGHDAIYSEIYSQSVLDEACSIIKEVMERPRWFKRGIPVEILTGVSWSKADLKEWHGTN